MMKLKDVLKIIDTNSKLCISRPDYDKGEGEENGEEIIFAGCYDAMKHHNVVRPFLDYEVYNIMAGGLRVGGMPGVLYIDVYKQEEQA